MTRPRRDEPEGTPTESAPTAPPPAVGAPGDTHEWVSFADPDENRTWLVDVTFLLSPWRCIFGSGCAGVLTAPAPELGEGCCSYGAHFSDRDDVARVSAAVALLEPDEWQYAHLGTEGRFLVDDSGTTTTALVDGACIFLNRPGHPGGAGCAFHLAAGRLARPPRELKPDVCWQLPLRREDTVGEDGHVTSKVHEWRRRDWGEAGEEFAWWCTEEPAAFTAAEPVVVTLADELRGLVGGAIYELIRTYLDAKMRPSTPLPHPALRRRATDSAQ